MRVHRKKLTAILLVIFILAVAAVGAVFGYLSAGSNDAGSTFVPATGADPTVIVATNPIADPTQPPEYTFSVDFPDPEYAVYVRVAVVITWKNADNDIYGELPVLGTDYAMTWNQEDWFQDENGFYYHRAMVTNADELAKLITSVSALSTAEPPEGGYSLHVEFFAQTIQALGYTDDDDSIAAVEQAWKTVVVETDANGDSYLALKNTTD